MTFRQHRRLASGGSAISLEDVLSTLYFTNLGHATHHAWWRSPESFGHPGSRGCLNSSFNDIECFCEWADFGIPVLCH